MKEGIGCKLIILALDRDPWKFYLMFLSQEIDVKLCQILIDIIDNNIYKSVLRHKNSCRNFLETGTSDRTLMGPDQELKWLAYSLYLVHFSFTVPLKRKYFSRYLQIYVSWIECTIKTVYYKYVLYEILTLLKQYNYIK